jgi:cell pole-organizing protein PopZ
MQTPREPSMEDILASIKRVIAEEKELRTTTVESLSDAEEDVLELDQQVADEPVEEAPVDLGPPMVDEAIADDSRSKLEALSSLAASAPPPPANPLEEMLKDMLRPALKAWLDEHLPRIVDEHVKKEISRITGRPL